MTSYLEDPASWALISVDLYNKKYWSETVEEPTVDNWTVALVEYKDISAKQLKEKLWELWLKFDVNATKKDLYEVYKESFSANNEA